MLIPFLMLIPMGFLLASSILFAIWVYKDAEANGENGVLWLLITLLIPNLLGLALYLLLVKREKQLRCPNCHHNNKETASYCEFCGQELSPDLLKQGETNPLWKYALGLLIAGIISIFVIVFGNMVYLP